MRTATGLTLIAFGTILAFAVTSQPSFLNLHITGCVIILTGIAGIAIPRRAPGWLRRRTVLKGGTAGLVASVEDQRFPPYVALNPNAVTPAGTAFGPAAGQAEAQMQAQEAAAAGAATATGLAAEDIASPHLAGLTAEEMVEETFEE